MNLFCLYLSGLSLISRPISGNSVTPVYLAALKLQPSGLYDARTGIYIGAVLFLLALLTFFFTISQRIKNQRSFQQEEQLLSDIFAKITHEIRTPLTVILGLSKQLREQKNLSNGNLSTYLNAIERQGRSLAELVNQLLDIANLQTSERKVEWKTGNIVAFVEMVAETFRIYARQKEIELFFFCDEAVIETDFVPDYLNKILHNLLSNAIKFSDEGTRINLIMEKDKKNPKRMIIKVIDQGKGISPEMVPHIFDLFYKCPHTGIEPSAGNGIGLALTKQLVETLDGTVRVKSEMGKGSTFTVELPLRRDERQLYAYWNPEKYNPPLFMQSSIPDDPNTSIDAETGEDDPRTMILLVEDNKDVALYVRSLFNQEQYRIIYASNGEKAWEIANQQIPDIVITDMVMPKKDGIELCRLMKGSPLLNHIPIIIISAKSGENDLIEGLSCGADSYIRKPFYPEELQVRVKNLLGTRQLLKEKYLRAILKDEKEEAQEKANSNADFLRHVTDIIYREMKNPEFTTVKLARELAISVSQLNKKLNAITGYPSSSYILQVKLKHAKKIFNTQNKTIGEVAAECGIYDVNYFSRIFKKYTGVTPTQYKRLPQE